MDFKVYVGESDFASLRENGAYYVDKTRILYELIQDTTNKVTLFTRPKRFGKTLMMSMMENFFNIRKDSKELFEGLAVSENKEFCDKWMNKYPVLFISFKDIEGLSFEDYYHAFLAGIFVGRGYGVESNKEHGLGRPDIKLKDKKNRRALVIEAKKADSQKAMDRMCDEALKQIVDGEYGKGFEGYRQVSCYGVAFFQKKAKVKLLK